MSIIQANFTQSTLLQTTVKQIYAAGLASAKINSIKLCNVGTNQRTVTITVIKASGYSYYIFRNRTVDTNKTLTRSFNLVLEAGDIMLASADYSNAVSVYISGIEYPVSAMKQDANTTLLLTGNVIQDEKGHSITNAGGVEVFSGHGYVTGGMTGANVATADRISFSTGITVANTASNLSVARNGLAGVSDGLTYGYVAGGYVSAATVIADKIVFSTGITAANTASNLSQARNGVASLGDGLVYGYFAGGHTGAVSNVVDRIVFATSVTSANTVSNLSQSRYNLTGLGDGFTYGYFAGGNNGSVNVVTTDRLSFATSITAANTVSNLSSGKYGPVGVSSNSTYGYFAGGTTTASTDRILFSTGVTSSNAASNLSVGRGEGAGISDSNSYGYVMGGTSGAATAIADKITFATSITSVNTASNLSQARYDTGAVSYTPKQGSYYFGGATNSYLTVAYSPDFDPSGNIYTLDCWFNSNITNTRHAVYNNCATSDPWAGTGFRIGLGGAENYGKMCQFNSAGGSSGNFESIVGNSVVTDGKWHHLAWVRNGSTGYFFIDGIVDKSFSYTKNTANPAVDIYIDKSDEAPSVFYLKNLRFSKGIARWTANFAPPRRDYII